MTLNCLITGDASACKGALRRHRLPSLKKSHFESTNHNSLHLLTLIGDPDRFPRRKNSSNAGDSPCRRPHDRLWRGRRKTRRDGPTLTTGHLLWPDEPRRAAFLLPFSRPNSDFLGSERAKRGGGGSARRSSRKCPIGKLSRNFVLIGASRRWHEH